MTLLKTMNTLILSGIMLIGSAHAADITVTITGLESDQGRVGCALHTDPDRFPTGEGLMGSWVDPANGTAVCRFEGVAPGDYAVAASHDLNGNQRTDTNFFGIPTEAWGVSRNVRPTMRAPGFDEARFVVGDADIELTISMAQ